MLDFGHLQQNGALSGSAIVQTFTASANNSSNTAVPYVLPKGDGWVYIVTVAGGGGGGGGFTAASGNAKSGGGGGGGGSISRMLIPRFLLPPNLWVYVGNGGDGGAAGVSGLSGGFSGVIAGHPTGGRTITSSARGNGGSAGTSTTGTGGSGGSAVGIVLKSSLYFQTAGVAGSTGDRIQPSDLITFSNSFTVHGGCGGGGALATNVESIGGGFPAAGPWPAMPGGAVGGGNGMHGFSSMKPLVSFGGTGGGGSASGVGGIGGNGAVGAGGGGGGGGATGGAGGRGGDGIVYIISF